jgi:hypothetical protein
MNAPTPSAEQLAAYNARSALKPVVLFYRYRCAGTAGAGIAAELDRIAQQHNGLLRWQGREEQVLIGPLSLEQYCCRLHFRDRASALRHVQAQQHLFAAVESLEVAVISEQPLALKLAIALMARVLPLLPMDRSTEDTPEPGMGSSVMPTAAAMETFLAHPQQTTPIVMVNWLRFSDKASYAEPQAKPVSGKEAYYRYGKVAFDTLHRLRARALFVSRYQQVLIGNNGEAGADLWDEFAMVEYPGRATFKLMASLSRYRRALHHRQAGLAERGQGLVVTATFV